MNSRISCCVIALVSVLMLPRCAGPAHLEKPETTDSKEVAGVLEVTQKQATIIGSKGDRVMLVADPPQTALGLETMMEKTAGALRHLHGRPVRVRGLRQGDILWSAEVIDPSEGKDEP